jgi:hypothetical protein
MTWPARAFMSSTRLRSGGRRLAWLCVLLCLTASAEFGSDLPIGYQEITDLGDGNYRVVARCVETRALLEAIAAKTGKPIVFDQPCNTYVSILHPEKVAPAAAWLDYIAGLGAYLECRLKDDGAWHVYSLIPDPAYDPALTEQEILQKFWLNLAPAPGLPSGIKEGVFFFHGVFIPPPYDITWQLTGDGTAEVAVNGVIIREFVPERIGSTMRHVPDLPASGQFAETADLFMYVPLQLYPSLLSRMPSDQALQAVVDFLNGQQLIEEVAYEKATRGISVRFVGQNFWCSFFPTNYDLDIGAAIQMGTEADRPLEDRAEEVANDVAFSLSRDRILIHSNYSQSSLSGGSSARLADCLRRVRDLPLAQAECLLGEVVGNRGHSRALVANLPGSYDRVISQLEAMRLRVSQPAPVQ